MIEITVAVYVGIVAIFGVLGWLETIDRARPLNVVATALLWPVVLIAVAIQSWKEQHHA